jgi:hypothetical protein
MVLPVKGILLFTEPVTKCCFAAKKENISSSVNLDGGGSTNMWTEIEEFL